MLSDAACARDAQKILDPLSLAAFDNASRTQAATSSNLRPAPACELDHDWSAQHPRRSRLGAWPLSAAHPYPKAVYKVCFASAKLDAGCCRPAPPNAFTTSQNGDRATVLANMEADWRASHDLVLKAWADRSEHDLWCADRHFGNPAKPWALEQFGDPQ